MDLSLCLFSFCVTLGCQRVHTCMQVCAYDLVVSMCSCALSHVLVHQCVCALLRVSSLSSRSRVVPHLTAARQSWSGVTERGVDCVIVLSAPDLLSYIGSDYPHLTAKRALALLSYW